MGITKAQAQTLDYGDVIYHVHNTNADGTPQRWRITGKCTVWKTRPDEFSRPLKHGLYRYGKLTHSNAGEFVLTEADAIYGEPHSGKRELLVGGFIVELKAVGMADHNNEASRRADLLAAPAERLALLEKAVKGMPRH